MKAKITRKLNKILSVALPVEYCTALGLNENDSVDIYLNSAKGIMILHKTVPSCCICNMADELIQISGKYICVNCKERLVDSKIDDCLY